jgi:RNA polymerase sigma-70 factor (ECF subfamily)
MVRVARGYVASDAIAEEVAQETWLGLLKGLERFEQRSSLRTWLFSILVNRALTRGQREARTVPFSSLGPADEQDSPTVAAERFAQDGAWASPPRPFEMPAERTAALELRGRLRDALSQLPERQAVVVTLHDVEGLDSDEVAQLLDLSVNNVRVLLHRGRAKLQAALAEYVLGTQPTVNRRGLSDGVLP